MKPEIRVILISQENLKTVWFPQTKKHNIQN